MVPEVRKTTSTTTAVTSIHNKNNNNNGNNGNNGSSRSGRAYPVWSPGLSLKCFAAGSHLIFTTTLWFRLRFYPILWMGKWRLREVENLVQSDTVVPEQGRSPAPGLVGPRSRNVILCCCACVQGIWPAGDDSRKIRKVEGSGMWSLMFSFTKNKWGNEATRADHLSLNLSFTHTKVCCFNLSWGGGWPPSLSPMQMQNDILHWKVSLCFHAPYPCMSFPLFLFLFVVKATKRSENFCKWLPDFGIHLLSCLTPKVPIWLPSRCSLQL